MGNRRLSLFQLTLLGLLSLGCGKKKGVETPLPAPSLEVVGATSRTVDVSTTHSVSFRYFDAMGGIPDAPLSFRLDGNPAGSQLLADHAQTGADGLAMVSLQLGPTPAAFNLIASAPRAAPVTVHFEVTESDVPMPEPAGMLEFTVVHDGTRTVSGVEVGLFAGTSCAGARRAPPRPAAVDYPNLNERRAFDASRGQRYALFAIGVDDRDRIAGEGCVDLVFTDTTHVDVPLADVAPPNLFEIEEQLDLTEALPTALDNALGLLAGLSEGIGTFIVNFALEYEGTPGVVVAVLEVAGPYVAELIDEALDGATFPDLFTNLIDAAASIEESLSGVTLKGTLDMSGELDEFHDFSGTHPLTSILVLMDGAIVAEEPVNQTVGIVATGDDPRLVDEHAFDLSLGDVVRVVIGGAWLPSLPGMPTTVGQALSTLVDCGSVATDGSADAATADAAQTACRIAVAAVDAQLDGMIDDLERYDTLYLSETGTFEEEEARGTTDARWVDSASADEQRLDGTLEGAPVLTDADLSRVRSAIATGP